MLHRITRGIAVLSAFTALTTGPVTTAHAQVVLGPISISSPGNPPSSGFPIQRIVNQSGLSPGYTSGVTDFTSYVASTTHDRLSLGIVVGTLGDPKLFSFDLGAEYELSAIGIWTAGSLWLPPFELYADDDTDFTNGVGSLMLGSTALADSFDGQAFSFGAIQTRFVHFMGPTVTATSNSAYGLNEVVFGGRAAASVPEPRALAMLLTGLALLATAAMRRRRA